MSYNPRVEIVPNEMGGFEAYGRRFEVSPATDVVVRFIEHRYDYLRYLNPEAHAVTLEFLGAAALATIVGWGVPETRERKNMQECEHEEWVAWHAALDMPEFEHDLEELPDSDDLEMYFEGDNGTS